MSYDPPPRATPASTLADLIRLVDADQSLTEASRNQITSAIRTVAKVLRREPHLISTVPADLRTLLNNALPLAVGVKGKRWRNAKSLLRKALALADPNALPARSSASLLPAWTALLQKPEAEGLFRGLSRFMRHCSVCGVTPDRVTQALFDAFLEDLTLHCVVRSPRETHRAAGNAWNTGVRTVPGWPQLTLVMPSGRKNPSLPWTAFPDSLVRDIDGYLTPRSTSAFDLSKDMPTLRDTTIEGKRRELRQFLTAVVEAGISAESLRTLADIVRPDVARAGLEVFLVRSNQQKTTRIHRLAYELLTLGRHWTKADPETVRTLQVFVKNLAPRHRGMTAKNNRLLQQFDDAVVRRLLGLPVEMMKEALAIRQPTADEARTAQWAVAIGILTVAPLRIGNIASLEIGRTLHLDANGRGHILIDHLEVKNEVLLEVPLPSRTVKLIKTYLKHFHPLLAPPGCQMLFPSADGGHKRKTVLSDQIKKTLARRCGIVMNAHLFRHFAAKIYLEDNPGDYGIVKLLLGHKSIETTIRIYCGTEANAAFRAYDKLLTEKQRGGGDDW